MQHLDHDMDDLFRKAGEHYPLKMDEDDFEKVFAKMDATPVEPPVAKTKNKVDFRALLTALLCFLILYGLKYYISSKENYILNSRNLITKAGTLKARPDDTHEVSGKAPVKQGNTFSLKEATVVKSKNDQPHPKNDVAFSQTLAKGNNISQKKKNSLFKHHGNFSQNRGLALSVLPAVTDGVIPVEAHFLQQSEVRRMSLILPYAIIEPGLHLAPVKISATSKQDTKGLYLGLTGAPEWSRVGSQTSTRSGFRGGVLAGYRLNSKLSVESGLTLGKNNYFSEGSYFKMSRMLSYMPAGMEILTLDGQTTNLEIPVTIRYNVLQRQRTGLFVTGGILSNIYLREKNHYQTMLNGIKDNQMGMYPENHITIASQVRLSAGYDRILSRSNNIRIEPYKSIPLRKTGMGSMPVFSSGLNIGVVHFFRR